ncbi:MAG: hypothetical protein AAFQ57_11365 [Cyanobacteria bacterium J06626_14]
MRRTILFLSRLLLGCWIVIVVAFLAILLSNAPNVPTNAPFASLAINLGESSKIYLPNPIFTCAETDQAFQCQTELQSRTLNLTWQKGGDYLYDLSNCRAQYDNRSIGCQETGMNYAPILAEMYEIEGLELSSQELQAIQHDYKSINVLRQLGEDRLFQISSILSLGTGLAAAFLAWLYPGRSIKAFASLAHGFGMYALVSFFLNRMSYSTGLAYGLTPETMDLLNQGVAIAAGLTTTLATALLVWRRLNHATKILVSLISSVGMFSLCWLSLNMIFALSFNVAETLWWLFTAISTIFALAVAIWPWLHKKQPIKRLLSLGSGFGAIAMSMALFTFLLLGLGYAD